MGDDDDINFSSGDEVYNTDSGKKKKPWKATKDDKLQMSNLKKNDHAGKQLNEELIRLVYAIAHFHLKKGDDKKIRDVFQESLEDENFLTSISSINKLGQAKLALSKVISHKKLGSKLKQYSVIHKWDKNFKVGALFFQKGDILESKTKLVDESELSPHLEEVIFRT